MQNCGLRVYPASITGSDVIIRPLPLMQGQWPRWWARLADISRQRSREQELREQAMRDVLTGIYNKAGEKLIDRMVKEKGQGLFLMLDLNDFKSINDTMGHVAGDAILTELGRVLKGTCRENDIVARIGGDEFVIFYPEADDESFIEEKRKEIRSLLKQIQVTDGASIYVSICGCMYRPNDDYISMFRCTATYV